MKDFDQFFRDRLDGERPFPRRDENWRQLSRRLEAFDSGIQDAQPLSNIRRWTTLAWKVAACAAAAATIWVGVQNYSLRRQNVLLNEQLTQIKAQRTNTPESSEPQNSPLKIADVPETKTPATEAQTVPHKPAVAATHNNLRTARAGNVKDNNHTNLSSVSYNARPGTTDNVPDSKSAGKEEMYVNFDSPATETVSIRGEEIPNGSFVWAKLPVPDSILSRPMARSLSIDEKSAPELPPLPIDAATEKQPVAPNITKPVKSASRVRVGIQAVAGTAIPAERGVSWHKGQSLSAEIRVWNRIWVGASADFIQYNIDTDNNPERFHLPEQMNPDPPGGPVSPNHYDLIRLQSEQRQRRFAAGVRYTLPVRGRITPSVQVGYVWAQMPASFVQYEFKKKPHGGGHPNPDPFDNKFFIRKTENHWEQNICRFGAGADYALGRWSLGLTAQYDKNFTNKDPLFDMLSFKLGASYQF